ncbi:MAG: sialidase family protein [Chloroflexota bacterium]
MILRGATAIVLLLTLLMTPIDTTDDLKGLGFPDSRKIAQDSQGNLYVAYRKKYRAADKLRYHIFVAKSADQGATWQTLNDAGPIENVGDYTQRVPSIAIDSRDNIHVAWYGLDAEQGTNEREIKYVRSVDGGESWTDWQNIVEAPDYSGGTLWQEHPVLHVGLDNTLYLVWQGKDATYQAKSQTKFSKSSDGGKSWTIWRNIQPNEQHNYSRPTLVSTTDGVLYVIAYGGVDGEQRLVWTTSTDGGESWAVWTAVSTGTADQRHVSLIADADNTLHAVWRQQPEGANTAPQIHYATFDGTAWGAPQLVSPQIALSQFFPSISQTTTGQLWVAWTETAAESGFLQNGFRENPTTGDIVVAFIGENGRFRPPVPLTNNNHSLYATLPWSHHHDVNRDIIWSENSQAPYTIQHQRLICTPTTATNSQLSFHETELELSWASSEAAHSYEIWQAASLAFTEAEFVAETADLSIRIPLSPGTIFYQVRPVNRCGEVGNASNTVGKFDL